MPAVLGSAADLEVGEPAVAIGSPLGRRRPVGHDRRHQRRSGGGSTPTGDVLHGMIQTDAPIAAGSSGGALCDGAGAVVGITTRRCGERRDGLGFAIPDRASPAVAEQLIDDGDVHHGWLGVEGADLDADRRRRCPGSPSSAACACVERRRRRARRPRPASRADDVVIAVDGDRRAVDVRPGRRAARPRARRRRVVVEVRRGRATASAVDVVLAERP